MIRETWSKVADYRGYDVMFNPATGMFRVDELDIQGKTLDEVKKAIDSGVKTKLGIKAYQIDDYYGSVPDIETVTLTSVTRSRRSTEAWVVNARGSRSKVGLDSLYAHNDKTKKELEAIRANKQEILRLEKQIEKQTEALERAYNPE